MSEPAYTRLGVDERRRQLLELGTELFTRHSYGELSMAQIAREAGISKALLYHYFPSKRDFFVATLARAAEELRTRTEPDPDKPPLEQLTGSLDGYLELIEENSASYEKLIESATTVAEVRELIDNVRELTAQRIIAGITPEGVTAPPAVRAAVRGWLWFMDGACLDWVRNRDFERTELRDMLLGTLFGSLAAAGGQSMLSALAEQASE
ncbi:MAG TPA: TetR/AcrR family transcriptional regulator [Thermoleophilaceae bacterium]|nr:TetR/AcrR family transcriptional regulator [Thermoleophilaceae bacterium]